MTDTNIIRYPQNKSQSPENEFEELKRKMKELESTINQKKVESGGGEKEREQVPDDPVARFLNKDISPEQIAEMKDKDSEFIHKRTAAGELIKPLKIILMLGLYNIIAFFIMYLFSVTGLSIVVDVMVIVMVSINGYYMLTAKKKMTYLFGKYNIAMQKSIFLRGSGGFDK
jgi:Flp pilus assembly protein TadB